MLTLTAVLGVFIGYLLRLACVELGLSLRLPRGTTFSNISTLLISFAIFLVSCAIAIASVHIPSHIMVYGRPLLGFALGFMIGQFVAYLIRRRHVSLFHLAVLAVLICSVIVIHPWTPVLRRLGLTEFQLSTPVGVASFELGRQTKESYPLEDTSQNKDASSDSLLSKSLLCHFGYARAI